jgi:hypothetical protein
MVQRIAPAAGLAGLFVLSGCPWDALVQVSPDGQKIIVGPGHYFGVSMGVRADSRPSPISLVLLDRQGSRAAGGEWRVLYRNEESATLQQPSISADGKTATLVEQIQVGWKKGQTSQGNVNNGKTESREEPVYEFRLVVLDVQSGRKIATTDLGPVVEAAEKPGK